MMNYEKLSKAELIEIIHKQSQQNQELLDTANDPETLCRNSLYDLVFTASPFAVLICDNTGSIIKINDTSATILQKSPEELIGNKIYELGLFSEINYQYIQQERTASTESEIMEYFYDPYAKKHIGLQYTPVFGKNNPDEILREIFILSDVSKWKNHENTLIEQNTLLDNVQYLSGIGSWTLDLETLEIELSDAVKKIFMITDRDVPKHYNDFLKNYIPLESHKSIQYRIQYAIEQKTRYSLEHKIIRKDKLSRHVQTNGKVIYNKAGKAVSLVGAMQDITERKKRQLELAESLAITNSMLEAVNNGVVIFDFENKIKSYNKQFMDIMDLSGKKLLGRSIEDFIELIGKQVLPETIRIEDLNPCYNEDDDYDYTSNNIVTKSGRTINISIKNSNLYHDKHTLVWVIRDISEWVQAQNQLVTYNKNLKFAITNLEDTVRKMQESRKEVEKAQALQSMFISNITHDLRTPINIILGFSKLLEETPLEETQKEYLTMIRKRSSDLLFLINDLLDLSKMQAGKLEINKVKFNLLDLLSDIANGFKIKAHNKNLTINTSVVPDFPACIYQDHNRIRQIITNLLDNAIKFTNKGGIALTIEFAPSEKHFPNIDVFIKLQDTGIGIPQEEQEAVFSPFIQSKNQNKLYSGTGLGLAIVKQLTELLDGEIHLSSTKGLGSIFTLSLRNVQTGIMCVSTDDKRFDYATTLQNKKIFFILPNEEHRSIYTEHLKNKNVELFYNYTPETIIEEVLEKRPDFIIEEVEMLSDTSVKYIKTINGQHRLNIPMIAISNNIAHQSNQKLDKYYDDILELPTTRLLLIETMCRFINDVTYISKTQGCEANKEEEHGNRIKALTSLQKQTLNLEIEELKEKTTDTMNCFILSKIRSHSQYIRDLGEKIELQYFIEMANKLDCALEKYNIDTLLMLLSEMNIFIHQFEDLYNEY